MLKQGSAFLQAGSLFFFFPIKQTLFTCEWIFKEFSVLPLVINIFSFLLKKMCQVKVSRKVGLNLNVNTKFHVFPIKQLFQ